MKVLNYILLLLISSPYVPSYTQASPRSVQQKAVLKPTANNKAEGIVTFEKTTEGIKVTGNLKNLTPGKHGMHIHEKGDCSAPDASSAGEHFNPEGKPHGARKDEERHTGDFGNVIADKNGFATFEFTDKKLNLDGTNSIEGKSVIVHANADDLKSQPSGNSGARLACGVIEGV